jgi:uncharacterized protein (TIGR02145 family)
MKKRRFITAIAVLFCFVSFCLYSCRKKADLPVVKTTGIVSLTATSAVGGGEVVDDGGSEVTARGVCWTVDEEPEVKDQITTDGTGEGTFISNIGSLDPSKRYFVRAYATNSDGTGYGDQVKFVTLAVGNLNFNPDVTYDTVYDIEGNAYKTVTINNKKRTGGDFGLADDKASTRWMAENLRTTTFNDGTPITIITDKTAWTRTWVNETPGVCWYDNNIFNRYTYGSFYNGYAVLKEKLCPDGWRIPTRSDWDWLTEALGGSDIAGGKMKEVGTAHWTPPNAGATNSSGLTVLGSGYRYDAGDWHAFGYRAYWWTSTTYDGTPGSVWLWFNGPEITGAGAKSGNQDVYHILKGYSIRCVKD